jgi:hypothetical protein
MSLTRRELLNRAALGAGAVALGDLGTLLAAHPASATTAASPKSGHLEGPSTASASANTSRTAAELFATLQRGSSIDLQGEMIAANDVADVPAGVTVQNGTFLGEMHLYDANRLTFEGCTFVGDPTTELKSICKFLGGDGWLVDNCVFRGGIVASQLGIGLNTRLPGRRASVPQNWTVGNCTFLPLDGQWGEYPQAHSIYCLTSPQVPMNAHIDNSTFTGTPFGAPLKLGGTGYSPHIEGVRGVTVTNCVFDGAPDGAGRCLAVLTQGQRTDVMLSGCTLTSTQGAVPWVQAMDGARLRMENTELPLGVVEYATWWRLVIFFPTDEKIRVEPGRKPRDILGHISWA